MTGQGEQRSSRKRRNGEFSVDLGGLTGFERETVPAPGPWLMFCATMLATLALVVALPVDPTKADVGRFEVRPVAAMPEDSVKLAFAAAWPQRFPVSLVPLARAPEPFPCHGREGLCPPATKGPPRRSSFVFLGSVRPDRRSSTRYIHRYRFRFDVPDVAPGNYAFVLWCAGCYEGRRGSLIASALPGGRERSGVLRVRSGRTRGNKSLGQQIAGATWPADSSRSQPTPISRKSLEIVSQVAQRVLWVALIIGPSLWEP
jgi:hypothetical protein